MQSSSADTNYTFGGNVVAVAESGNQSSPATGDSGAASGTTWNNIPSRAAKAHQVTDQSGQQTPRRSTAQPGTRMSIQDRSPRTRETPGKRRTDDPEHFSLEQAAREEILEFQGEYEVEYQSHA